MSTRKLVYTGLFAALGIVIPQLFHLVGGPGFGSIFLPMHYATLIGGMILGPVSGLMIGLVSVLVGMGVLGMPQMPIGAFMLIELGVYGLITGLLYNKFKLPSYVALVAAMIGGRLVELAAMQVAIRLLGISLPPVFGTIALFGASIPGMVIQLVLIPTVMILLENALSNKKRLVVE